MNISLEEVLEKCLSKVNVTRQEGEYLIETFATSDFGLLLEQCSIILADNNKKVPVRQLCATLIKNLINFIPHHQGKWSALHLDQKLAIKNHILFCLSSDNKDIRKASGISVAGKLHLTQVFVKMIFHTENGLR
jgi:hypothetical protein